MNLTSSLILFHHWTFYYQWTKRWKEGEKEGKGRVWMTELHIHQELFMVCEAMIFAEIIISYVGICIMRNDTGLLLWVTFSITLTKETFIIHIYQLVSVLLETKFLVLRQIIFLHMYSKLNNSLYCNYILHYVFPPCI